MFLENEMIYGVEFETTAEIMGKDFLTPIGKAKNEREGTDITITAHAKMVGHSLAAAEVLMKEHGISCEVTNLRSLRLLERSTILKSVKKTHRIVNGDSLAIIDKGLSFGVLYLRVCYVLTISIHNS